MINRISQRNVILHDNVAGIIILLDTVLNSVSEQLNLREDAAEGIVDWIVTDILNDVCASKNIRLLSHYRYDEALVVKEAVSPEIIKSTRNHFEWRLTRYKNTEAKAMISGTEMFITLKEIDEKRL